MENVSLPQALVFGLFLAFFISLGVSYRTSDASVFHTVGRKAGSLRIFCSMFTIVGASEFVIFSTLAFVFGWKSIFFFLGTTAGFLALGILAPQIRANAERLDLHSIPDFASSRDCRLAGAFLAMISLMFTLALVVMQIIIGGNILSSITSISFEICAAAICIAIAFYLIAGGYNALLNTDVVQAFAMFTITLGLAVVFLFDERGPESWAINALPGVEIDLLVFAIGGFFAIFGGPEVWQRILTAKSDKVAIRSSFGAGIGMLVWGSALVAATLAIKTLLPDAKPDDVFFTFLGSGVSALLLGFISLILLAALLSTADTELFAGTVIVQKAIKGPKQKLSIASSQFIIVFLMVVAYGAAITTGNLLNLYFALVYLTFVTGPIAIALILNRGNNLTLSVGIGAGFVALILLYSTGRLSGGWYPLCIIPLASIPLIVGPFTPSDSSSPEEATS